MATPDAAAAPPFAAGVDKVWLDGKAEATLADTTAQIGAPAAWAAGGRAPGSGSPSWTAGWTHPSGPRGPHRGVPELRRRRGRHRPNGHGTHTASTVAGTGAASGGKEQGVAPGADLLVGKVLGDTGSGSDVGHHRGHGVGGADRARQGDQHEPGRRDWHTQDDPMSQAVNQLSAETGALFVIAAGNDGQALQPRLAGNRGRRAHRRRGGRRRPARRVLQPGPRMNDDALKPDLTAPGVDVLAARSQYRWGEGYYRLDSGTSMAAPHVAGAAVLLAQKHPEWTGQQIKDALMSTSVLTPDYSPYQAGTGRLDVAAAYRAGQIIATGSVDAGLVPWSSGTQRQPIKRKITYTNTTDSPITLRSLRRPRRLPRTAFTLAADHVTVPARGTSTVGVTVDPNGLASGQYAVQVNGTAHDR